MDTQFCSYLRARLAKRLRKLGLAEVQCHDFGNDFRGHGRLFAGSVIYFQGRGLLAAVSCSVGDSVSCFVGGEGADIRSYTDWPSLWEIARMDPPFPDDETDEIAVAAYLDQFPEDPDGMADLVALKLEDLLGR